MNSESLHANFYGLGIAPAILEALERLKFKTPTPIQEKAIPVAMEGKDVVGIAQTGTGKTLAYGVPILQRLLQEAGRALILVPTRELAFQVDEALRRLAQSFHIRPVVLVGGMNMGVQIQLLRKSAPRILVATPGRLLDHLEQKTVNLSDVRVVVIDEADRMLDMGFAPQVRQVARFLPAHRQTLLFSATMPDGIVELATSYMKLPIRVEVARPGTAVEKIVQELFIVRQESKKALLVKLLSHYQGSVLVFSRTKIGAKKIARVLHDAHFKAAEIHADRSLGQRREALEGFKTGRYRVLVATDIAARGIDVKGIELVVNYDLPEDSENYIHRIGRTGRMGMEGRAISFATPDQGSHVRSIEKLMRKNLTVSSHPAVTQEKFYEEARSKTPRTPYRFSRSLRRKFARHIR